MPIDIPANVLAVDANEHAHHMDEWALSIGRFLVAFTSCEFWTYQFIRTFGSQALHDAVADQSLKPRTAIAQALISDIGLTPEVQVRVDEAFVKLRQLVASRNLVAHNPPLVHVYTDKNGNVFVRHELRSAKDESKDIGMERLVMLTKEARELDEEFAILYGIVRKPENHLR